MKRLLFSILIVMLPILVLHTEHEVPKTLKTALIPSQYDRNAITVVVLDNHCNYIADIRAATPHILITEKYDDNLVDMRLLRAAADADDDAILEAVNASKLGNQIIAKWFNRAQDGSFDMAVIAERGMYNATVEDMILASASKLGMDKIRDAGQALVENSYVLVLSFHGVMSMEEYYDQIDTNARAKARRSGEQFSPTSRTQNGWKADVRSFLFKIDPAFSDVLFNELWIYEDDSPAVKAEKKALFENTRFGFSYVMEGMATTEGTQNNPSKLTGLPVQKSREELFALLLNTSVHNSLLSYESVYEAFRVKTPLYATKPIRVKVGTKEGLTIDQRFYVYETVMKKNNDLASKKRGVVNVKKVANNSAVASLETDAPMSRFYQVSGKKLEPGMTLQQRNAAGIGLSLGGAFGGLDGIYVKGEFNTANLNQLVPGTKSVIPVSQMKFFAEGAFSEEQYIGSTYTFTRFHVGISKGFYFMRNFSLAPFLAYGAESAEKSSDTTGTKISGDFFTPGAYLSMNLFSNLQLVLTYQYHIPIGNADWTYDDDRPSVNTGNPYTYYFYDREGQGIELGLRFEF